eukprot:g6530.t1
MAQRRALSVMSSAVDPDRLKLDHSASEPLLVADRADPAGACPPEGQPVVGPTCAEIHEFLSGRGSARALRFEAATGVLILLNIVVWILSTDTDLDARYGTANAFRSIEVVSVAVFSLEWLARAWSAAADPHYAGMGVRWGVPGTRGAAGAAAFGRVAWALSFWSLLDLCSVLPFFTCLPHSWRYSAHSIAPPAAPEDDVPTFSPATGPGGDGGGASYLAYHGYCAYPLPNGLWLRVFRLFRVLYTQGGYNTAIDELGSILRSSSRLLWTSSFVGACVWLILAAAYHVAERANPLFAADDPDGECSGCFDSIVSASYFALVNLFGEFPLVNDHNLPGKFIAVLAAVVGVGVFGIPTGILGAGFEDMMSARKERRDAERKALKQEEQERSGPLAAYDPARAAREQRELQRRNTPQTARARAAAFVEARTAAGARFEYCVFILIALNVLCFMLSTVKAVTDSDGDKHGGPIDDFFTSVEIISIVVFTLELALRCWAAREDPRYREAWTPATANGEAPWSWGAVAGMLRFLRTPYSLIDLASILPFYINLIVTGGGVGGSSFVRLLRLLRMLKSEHYAKVLSVFALVLRDNTEILTVAGLVCVALWVFFSSLLYWSERTNAALADANGLLYYRSVGASMWITLLNLTGECPLYQYTWAGQVITGFIGVVAVGVFSVPMGVLGAGFQEYIEQEEEQQQRARGDADEEPDDQQRQKLLSSSAGLAAAAVSGQATEANARAAEADTCLRRGSLCQQAFAAASDLGNGDPDDPIVSAGGGACRCAGARRGPGFYLNVFIFALICLTVTEGVLETVPSIMADPTTADAFSWFEGVVVVIFTLEWLFRLYAAAADPALRDVRGGRVRRSAGEARLRHAFSFFSVVDLIAVVLEHSAMASSKRVQPSTKCSSLSTRRVRRATNTAGSNVRALAGSASAALSISAAW